MNWAYLWEWIRTLLKVDKELMYYGSLIGAFGSLALGGFDKSLTMLTILIGLDYLTGLIAAFKTGTTDSKVGFIGIARKAIIYLVIAFITTLDGAMQMNLLLRSMVICGYALNEGISIVENVDRLGFGHWIPPWIRNKLDQLREEKMK